MKYILTPAIHCQLYEVLL